MAFENINKSTNTNKANKFDTRSYTKCNCIAIQFANFPDKYNNNELCKKFRLCFAVGEGDSRKSQWSGFFRMPKSIKGWLDRKCKIMQFFENSEDAVTHIVNSDEDNFKWLFDTQFEVIGVKNGEYVNIKSVTVSEDQPIENPAFFDLAGFPPYRTAKDYGVPSEVEETFVRLEDGSTHKVEDAEYKDFEAKPASQPATNDDDGLPF